MNEYETRILTEKKQLEKTERNKKFIFDVQNDLLNIKIIYAAFFFISSQ